MARKKKPLFGQMTLTGMLAVDWLKDNAQQLATDIIRCRRNGKALALPISLEEKGTGGKHANMLLFNNLLNTAEHFEPHGIEAGFDTDKRQIDLKPAIDEINKYMGDEIRYEYLPPSKVCPMISEADMVNGLQTLDSKNIEAPNKRPLKTKFDVKFPTDARMFEGVTITEAGGYCAMWSNFFLDLRLKTLKRPVDEVMNSITRLFSKDYKDKKKKREFIFLMRGVSANAFDLSMTLVKQGKITLEELIMAISNKSDYMGRSIFNFTDEKSTLKQRQQAMGKFNRVADEYLLPIWKKFTDLGTPAEKVLRPKNKIGGEWEEHFLGKENKKNIQILWDYSFKGDYGFRDQLNTTIKTILAHKVNETRRGDGGVIVSAYDEETYPKSHLGRYSDAVVKKITNLLNKTKGMVDNIASPDWETDNPTGGDFQPKVYEKVIKLLPSHERVVKFYNVYQKLYKMTDEDLKPNGDPT